MSFSSHKTVVTRKEHRCEGCLTSIPKGSAVEYSKGQYDGEFYSYHLCTECQTFLQKADRGLLDDLRDNGWGSGDIGMWRKEAEKQNEIRGDER